MLGELDDVDLLDSRQFLMAVRRLADGLQYGVDKSPYAGSGLEYLQSRPYEYGDPVRSIDWRVTARTGRTYVKEYEATKRVPCYMLIDTSASMKVATHAVSKYSRAIQIAGGLALAALDRAMPVGVQGVGEDEFRIEPSLARDRVMGWVQRLRRFRFEESTRVGDRVSDLGTRLGSRSLLIVLSDLHDPSALPALRLAAQTHDCIAIQLRDPAERGLRGAGLMFAREAESGRAFVAGGRRIGPDTEALDGELKRARIDHLRIDTDKPFVHHLRNFLRQRDARGRGAR